MLTALVPKSYRATIREVAVPNCDKPLPITVIGKGEPMLLLHAYGMDAREFLPFVLPLTTKYQFYIPHLRGFGLSKEIPLTQFDFVGQYAEDVNAIIEQICRWREVSILPVAAISMGSQVMWAYFGRYGSSRVSRYLNIDQTPTVHNQPDWRGGLFGERQDEVFDVFQRLLTEGLAYQDVESFTHLPHDLKRRTTDTERMFSLMSASRPRSQAFIKVMTHQTDHQLVFFDHKTWKHKMRCLQAYLAMPYDFRSVAEKLPIPVVNLIGGRSQLYDPEWQRKVTEMLPNATEIILENSGHAVPLDEPIGFYKVLKGFLEGKYDEIRGQLKPSAI
ncbi:alpha/beta fold hydrolase [Psychrobacter arenosus]|uniref:alpha/beta fold hydrolase n=1 Tax=Psychrobacter arenosus TaxID=256326 RepID=UPI0019182DD9|nr:alpha/beta hydrolase [Psychrobacter arenosus]